MPDKKDTTGKQIRGHHEGTYRKKTTPAGREYIEGSIQIDGKRYYVSANTLSAAKEMIRKIRNAGGKNTRPAKKITLKEYMQKWLENEVKLSKKQNTYENYKATAEKHIYPILGEIAINKLNRMDVQELIKIKTNETYTIGKKNKKEKKISPRYIKLITVILSAAMRSAVLSGIVNQNPIHDLILPKDEKSPPSILSTEEMFECFSIDTSGDALATMCKVIMFTGMRRGEIVPLKWTDIDFKNKTLSIERSAVVINGKTHITSPKNKTSNRTIPLTDNVYNLLVVWKTEQEKHKEMMKSLNFEYEENNYVFPSDKGQLRHPSNIRLGLNKLLKKTQLHYVTIHGLRHSYATMLLDLDVPLKVVQELLGHSSMATTGNIYSHATMGIKLQAVDKINNHKDTTNP